MHTCAGVDVGTRGIRIAYGNCPHIIGMMIVQKEEIEDALKYLQGFGIKELCVAGGYQWAELEDNDVFNRMDEVLPYVEDRETHGFRRLLSESLKRFRVRLLPSAGASGGIPEGMLYNVIDSGTPDKVAKANYIYWKGKRTFTLVDKGCFYSVLYVEDGTIVAFVSATRGQPGPCSPGLVDLELLLLKRWPNSKLSIMSSGVPEWVAEEWLRFYRPTFIGEEVVCPGEDCDELSAAKGAFLWCCGYKLRNIFSDKYERRITLRDQEG